MKWFSEGIAMKHFIFVSVFIFTLVHCRPQDSTTKTGVEIEKQTIIKLPSTNEQSRQLTSEEEQLREANTKDILEKIAQVNLNHGLTPKTFKKPFYSALTSNQYNQPKQTNESKGKQLPNFQFSNTPLSNPIFDYLQRNQNKNVQTNTYKQAPLENDDDTDDENEDIPEGYTIKRKVTHQQTLIIPNYSQMPNPYYNPMLTSLPTQNQFDPAKEGQYGLFPINQLNPNSMDGELKTSRNNTNQNKTLDELTLAKQNFLINNVKNIISNSQGVPGYYPNYYNPYNPYQAPMNPYMTPYQPIPQYNPDPFGNYRGNPAINPYNSIQNYIPYIQNSDKLSDTYYANLQTAKDSAKFLGPNQNLPSTEGTGRQFTPPFSEYFPIIIKNPFQQMFQAFTSMVEYGPDTNLCRNHAESRHKTEETVNKSHLRSGKSLTTENTENIKLKDKDTNTEIIIQKLDETTDTPNDNEFYIEGLEIITDKEKLKKPDTNKQIRELEEQQLLIEEDKFFNHRHPQKDDLNPSGTGNGIFIQKLKVRKGGVAIAGPGGIATAGSGGTAIVGPNGFAYTQPNGVAIAGPGAKVVSVDPSVDLSEFIQNMLKNKTMTRLGKLVAVGPIVYYNLGQN